MQPRAIAALHRCAQAGGARASRGAARNGRVLLARHLTAAPRPPCPLPTSTAFPPSPDPPHLQQQGPAQRPHPAHLDLHALADAVGLLLVLLGNATRRNRALLAPCTLALVLLGLLGQLLPRALLHCAGGGWGGAAPESLRCIARGERGAGANRPACARSSAAHRTWPPPSSPRADFARCCSLRRSCACARALMDLLFFLDIAAAALAAD
jgi:hypothetical protein